MAKGISGVSVQRGYDLREFILVPFGGAAANHAVDIAEELGIRKIVVPPMAGNFSAVGLAVADVQHDYVRTVAKKEQDVDPAELLAMFRIMEDEGMRQLREENVEEKDVRIEWSADMRYEGQSWELNTPVARTAGFGPSELRDVIAAFHALHKKVYSYNEPKEHTEFINLRVRAIGKNASLTPARRSGRTRHPSDAGLKETRPIYFREKGFVEVPVYERDRFGSGSLIPGPCLIEEQISTTLIPHGWTGRIDRFRNIVITPDGAGR